MQAFLVTVKSVITTLQRPIRGGRQLDFVQQSRTCTAMGEVGYPSIRHENEN